MGLRDIGARLPPGFRFYPSDEELVCHYLHKKVANEEALRATALIEIDLHTCEPWQLPEVAKLNSTEYYFFSFRDRKYATGYRTNRATASGYWKATGKDRVVLDPRTREIVGMRKTLVFYRNRAPNGIKTGWIMHEFRLESPNMPPKEDWVLCRVFHKSKEESTNANNNQQMMFNYPTNTSHASPSSPNLPYHDFGASGSFSVRPATTFWGLSTSSSSSQKQPAKNPINNSSLISSNTIIPSSTSSDLQNHPHDSSVFTSNPSTYNHGDGKHVIIKVGSSCSNTSFSDLMNSNAMNDDVYGFLWGMDMDQEVNLSNLESAVAAAHDHEDILATTPLPSLDDDHDHLR